MTDVYVSKGILIELLGNDAFNFYKFLNNDGEDSKAISRMYNDMVEVNLSSPSIQYGIIPMLVGYNIISQDTVNNLNNYIASKQV